MSLRLNEVMGYYIPSFFYIWINGKVQDEVTGQLIPTPTLIHEYCHFLQDITTNFGLSNIITTSTALLDCAAQAGSSKDTIKIPVGFASSSARRNTRIMDELWGDTDAIDYIDVDSYERKKAGSQQISDTIEITLKNGDLIDFGVLAILESMAKSLEESLFEKPRKSPEYPYSMCKELIKLIHEKFPISPEMVLALCDSVLMYENPKIIIVEALECMKREGFVPLNMNSVYDYVWGHPSINQSNDSYMLPYITNFNTALTAIGRLFGSDATLANEKEWIIHRFKQASDLRKAQPRFWSEILDVDSKQQKQTNLVNKFQNIGFPITYDDEHYMYVHDVRNEDKIVNYDVSGIPPFFTVITVLALSFPRRRESSPLKGNELAVSY